MSKKKKVVEYDNTLMTYFKEIGEYKPLSKDEEQDLWKRYKKNNDLSARDKIIKSNLKFVANVAKSFQGMGLSYSDLIAEGNLGLMKAIDKFDYELGNRTISYSVWWIKQAIMEALSNRNALKSEELPQDFERQTDCDEDIFYQADNGGGFNDSGTTAENREIDIKTAIPELMECLTDRERVVLTYYFGINGKQQQTLDEIGQFLCLTKERVRQIKERALKKLRGEALKKSITTDIYE